MCKILKVTSNSIIWFYGKVGMEFIMQRWPGNFNQYTFNLELKLSCSLGVVLFPHNYARSQWSPEPYLLPVFQDSELLDKRRQCFSVQMDTGEDVVFSVELESDLVLWEKAFQMATYLEVERIQVNTCPWTEPVQPVRTKNNPEWGKKGDPCTF